MNRNCFWLSESAFVKLVRAYRKRVVEAYPEFKCRLPKELSAIKRQDPYKTLHYVRTHVNRHIQISINANRTLHIFVSNSIPDSIHSALIILLKDVLEKHNLHVLIYMYRKENPWDATSGGALHVLSMIQKNPVFHLSSQGGVKLRKKNRLFLDYVVQLDLIQGQISLENEQYHSSVPRHIYHQLRSFSDIDYFLVEQCIRRRKSHQAKEDVKQFLTDELKIPNFFDIYFDFFGTKEHVNIYTHLCHNEAKENYICSFFGEFYECDDPVELAILLKYLYKTYFRKHRLLHITGILDTNKKNA